MQQEVQAAGAPSRLHQLVKLWTQSNGHSHAKHATLSSTQLS